MSEELTGLIRQHKEHNCRLFLALVRIYDNYITPLGCNVVCWKMREDKEFLLGMTVTKPQFDVSMPPEKYYITYHIPMRYWRQARVMEMERAPGYASMEDNLERLFRL